MKLSRCLSFGYTIYELYVFPRPLRFFCGSVYDQVVVLDLLVLISIYLVFTVYAKS